MSGGYGYSTFADPHWHHYWAADPSLLGLVLPFLLIFVVARLWRTRRANIAPSRPEPPAASSRAVTKRAVAVLPVLASDLEREEATRLLSHAVGEGRLSIEEGTQRIDSVLRARHRHELAGLVADLPVPAPLSTTRRLAAAPLHRALLAAAGAVVVVAVLLQAIAGLWELWPVAVLVLGVAAVLPRR